MLQLYQISHPLPILQFRAKLISQLRKPLSRSLRHIVGDKRENLRQGIGLFLFGGFLFLIKIFNFAIRNKLDKIYYEIYPAKPISYN